MISAQYSLIRFIPDVARGEQLNVGIVGWTQNHLFVDLDDLAISRVVRENPHLAKDALAGLRDHLRAELAGGPPAETVARWLETQRGYPVVATERRHTTLKDDSAGALEDAVDRLLARVVRPRRRHGGGSDAGKVLERRLQPLVRSRRVVRNHVLPTSRSGVPRSVAYFANSTANLALDVVKLTVKSDEIIHRADAEAFKIEDILANNALNVIVFCAVSDDDSVREITASAERIIESVGAVVVTSVDEAARQMTHAVL